jgi:two-component system chemotaxis response regulator CheY
MRILIVDDEPSAAALLEVLLTPYGACEVVDSGAGALSSLRAAAAQGPRYDLVCLDVHLGDMQGNAVLDDLREREARDGVDPDRRTQVIMVTVVDDPVAIDAAFGQRCDAYVVKPVTRERLVARLRRLGFELPGREP